MVLKRRNHPSNQMPEVNLVPMMDVVMTILTFFIIVSMTLTKQQNALNVTLPSANAPANPSANKGPDPMIVAIDAQGKLAVKDVVVSETDLSQQVQTFLASSPQAAVLLKADRKVSYEQLAKVLGTLQKVGGERVSLAIEGN
ncbi:ExbD/TolR family protein [Alkalinema pantanalense CENA528]|uniref:ExbD/TolR family protein n=1 Tax=Alkalinema pantanalense TaxID=1620705 RepID=UPI003D6EE0BC